MVYLWTVLQMNDKTVLKETGRKELTQVILENNVLTGFCKAEDKKNCIQIL